MNLLQTLSAKCYEYIDCCNYLKPCLAVSFALFFQDAVNDDINSNIDMVTDVIISSA